MKAEKTCPIDRTHTRLHQVHRLWHQTLDSYPDPEAFCTNLNATIEALRSVTFLLQKEQKAIPEFASWYENWQARMKNDALMRWLVTARNRIEKEGDLDTFSTARVSLLASWDGPKIIGEFQVNPLLSPKEIVDGFDNRAFPAAIRREGLLIIERRWVVRELPEEELLEVLGYCYGFLATLVADAHSRLGFIMRTFTEEAHGKMVRSAQLGGRLPCMAVTPEMRLARYHLLEGSLISLVDEPVVMDKDRGKEAALRYKISAGELSLRPAEDILELSDRVMEHARRVLATDKFHLPMVTLIYPDRKSGLYALELPDRQAVYLQWQLMAERIKVTGAIGLITVAECWSSAAEDLKIGQRAADSPARQEVLQVIAATADGRTRIHSCVFSHEANGEIKFDAVESYDGTKDDINFLQPVFRVWSERKEDGSGIK